MFSGAPRYKQLVQFLTGDEEIVPPGLELETDRPEWKYLSRTALMSGVAGQTSAAGTFPSIALVNFAGSNTIGVITRIKWTLSTLTDFVHYRLSRNVVGIPGGYVQSGNQGVTDSRDKRVASSSTGSLKICQAAIAATIAEAPFESYSNALALNLLIDDRDPQIILGPGSAFFIETIVAGVRTLQVTIKWYERGARAEELALL